MLVRLFACHLTGTPLHWMYYSLCRMSCYLAGIERWEIDRNRGSNSERFCKMGKIRKQRRSDGSRQKGRSIHPSSFSTPPSSPQKDICWCLKNDDNRKATILLHFIRSRNRDLSRKNLANCDGGISRNKSLARVFNVKCGLEGFM